MRKHVLNGRCLINLEPAEVVCLNMHAPSWPSPLTIDLSPKSNRSTALSNRSSWIMFTVYVGYYWMYCWWRTTVVRTLVFDRRTFPGLRHDVQLTGDLQGENRPLYTANMAISAIHPLGVDKWVVSWTQGVRNAYLRGGAAWGMLTCKGRYGVVCR